MFLMKISLYKIGGLSVATVENFSKKPKIFFFIRKMLFISQNDLFFSKQIHI